MSSLSEQERIGLEEVFLSISPSRNFFERWAYWGKTLHSNKTSLPFSLTRHTKIWIKNGLKTHKITKLLNKMQKRRKI